MHIGMRIGDLNGTRMDVGVGGYENSTRKWREGEENAGSEAERVMMTVMISIVG